MMIKKVLVLGGYGNFGKLICEQLSKRSDIELVIAGRSRIKGQEICASLEVKGSKCKISSLKVDVFSDDLIKVLNNINPFIVINTCGPFQGQDYHVPISCIKAGSHYVDLADDRHFVCEFCSLDKLARQNEVIAISGASSVPGISSVVIDQYSREFGQLDEIDFAIVPGSNVELGKATLKGILSYVGQPFTYWNQKKFTRIYGWMNIRRGFMGNTLGYRWLGNVNIPDLELFPTRYRNVNCVRFQAGHELTLIHLSLAFMAILTRLNLIKQWNRFTDVIYMFGELTKRLGSDCGGMVIQLSGKNENGQEQKIIWRLIAWHGVGPWIPAFSTIILVNKILEGEIVGPMAVPCLGLYDLNDLIEVAETRGITAEKEKIIG